MVKNISEVVTIDWKPVKSSKIPIYRQIINYIVDKVSKGDWLIGQRLPSQRELAKEFNVNRSTIAEAISELNSLGLIESNFGKGTRIINNTWSLLVSTSPPNWKSYIDSGIHRANIPTIQTINKLEYLEGIIRLSTGEMSPELFPHEMMKKVLNNVSKRARSLNYLEPLGLLELRRTLSNYLSTLGLNIPPSQILIVSGSLQALQLISISILKPNSTVFVEVPSYLKSLHVFQSTGMNLQGVPMDSKGIMSWMINKENLVKDTSLLYTIPTFHNPTGIVMSKRRRSELLDWCRINQLPIIEDDVYRELWFEDMPPLPLKAHDKNGMVLYLGSISKSLAPGLRLGWLAGPESVVERLGDIKMQTDYGSSSLSQWALTEWIESGLYEDHLKVLKNSLIDRRNFVLDILEKYFKDIAAWNKPEGGYYIWLKLNRNIATDKLFHLALKDKILINPGNIYDFSKNQFIRISYSYASPQNLTKGLKRLSEIINIMYKSS